MRGEHGMHPFLQLQLLGSSPHARGALGAAVLRGGRAGIIPACAGSTLMQLKRAKMSWDHPRMRGEHVQPTDFMACVWGSSPHARGAPAQIAKTNADAGIIPACAGSTL